jgi:hypothetical protein
MAAIRKHVNLARPKHDTTRYTPGPGRHDLYTVSGRGVLLQHVGRPGPTQS